MYPFTECTSILECLIEDEDCTPDYPIKNHGSIVSTDPISKESDEQEGNK